MTILPEIPRGARDDIAPIFTRPVSWRFLTPLRAAVLTAGQRTVARLLRSAGSPAAGAASSCRRGFSQALWSSLRPAYALARKVVAFLPANEPNILVVDDKARSIDGNLR